MPPQKSQSGQIRAIPDHLREAILEPYKPECVYVRKAYRDTSFDSELVAFADVCVPQTFYGSQTGHFNAVESLLCLNQLAYLTMADFVSDDRPHDFRTAIGATNLKDFKENVLSRTFITSVKTHFKRMLDGRNVVMRLALTSARRHAGMAFLASEFAFLDGTQAMKGKPAFFGGATFAMPAN